MASKIILFYRPLSPPSRAVLLTAKAIGINLDLKDINVLKGEQLTPEFRKVFMCFISPSVHINNDFDIPVKSSTYHSHNK